MNETQFATRVQTSLPMAPAEESHTATAARLFVILFDIEEEALLARRILEVAGPRQLSIVLMAVAPEPKCETKMRRRMATLAAFLREQSNPSIPVEIHGEARRDWMLSLGSQLRPADTLACYSGHMAGIMGRPLCDVLAYNLNRSVYDLPRVQDVPRDGQRPLSRLVSWAGSLASIVGFLLLQVRIVATVQGWPQTALLLVALTVEIGVIWLLNSMLGQL